MFNFAETINKCLLVFYLYRGRVDKEGTCVVKNYANAFRIFGRLKPKVNEYISVTIVTRFDNVYSLISYLDLVISNIETYDSGTVKELPVHRSTPTMLDDWLTDNDNYRAEHKVYTKLIYTKLNIINDRILKLKGTTRNYHLQGLDPVFQTFLSLATPITKIL